MLIIKIIYVWYGETYGSEGLCLVAFCINCNINKYANYKSQYQLYTFNWRLLQSSSIIILTNRATFYLVVTVSTCILLATIPL
jgi:hypothetical protein